MNIDVYTNFLVGDVVRPIVPIEITERFWLDESDRGKIIGYTRVPYNYEIEWLTGSNKGHVSIHQNTELVLISREPEQDEPKPGYDGAAEDHLVGVMDEGTISTATRSIMVAEVYARLEIARQLGRIADALGGRS